jgi:hypothetical protein
MDGAVGKLSFTFHLAESSFRMADYFITPECRFSLPTTLFLDGKDDALKVSELSPSWRRCTTRYGFQWACGVGAFISSTNILLNLARSKSIWISTNCAPSFGLSLSVHVSVFP